MTADRGGELDGLCLQPGSRLAQIRPLTHGIRLAIVPLSNPMSLRLGLTRWWLRAHIVPWTYYLFALAALPRQTGAGSGCLWEKNNLGHR
jgi:hypothetical protein